MPNRLWLVLLSVLLLVACAGLPGTGNEPVLMNSQNLDKLANRQWELKTLTVDGQRVIMHVDATQTVRFGADGKVTGFAGVN